MDFTESPNHVLIVNYSECSKKMCMARDNVFVFQTENFGTRSENGSPPLTYDVCRF